MKWIPAHKGVAAIGNVTISDGSVLTNIDWRANRLVDIVAKSAAARAQAPTEVLKFLASARSLLLTKAVTLAQATFLANNCKVTSIDASGNVRTTTRRDTSSRPVPQSNTQEQPQPSRHRPKPSPFKLNSIAQQIRGLDNTGAGLDVSDGPSSAASVASAAVDANDAHASYNAIDDSRTLFDDIDADALVDKQREVAAIASLPKPQVFQLSQQTAMEPPRRGLPSRDKQDIARRAATRSRAANATNTSRMVQDIGQRANAVSAEDKPSAASRLQALRERIRARQDAG